MISKQPTIDDIYNFDAYISTPGVREGLMQRATLDDAEFTLEDTDDGQAMFFNTPHGEQMFVGMPEKTMPGRQEGDVLMAAGPSQTVSDSAPPIRVGRAGVPFKGPSMSDITEPAKAMADMFAGAFKGAVQGFTGTPGELEGFIYGLKELATRNADTSMLDAFVKGYEQKTILPKTEEVKAWLDKNVGTATSYENPFETIGEVVAPGGQVKAGKAVVKGTVRAAKALAPEVGQAVVKSMEKLGTPLQMNIVPDVKVFQEPIAVQPSISTLSTSFDSSLANWLSLDANAKIQKSKEASVAIAKYVGTDNQTGKTKSLLTTNGKLLKTEKGFEGGVPIELPDGRNVESAGLALSPAFKEGKFTTCPNSASCAGDCLGKTSGGYFFMGGGADLNALKGPRLRSFHLTQAFMRDPENFVLKLNDEVTALKIKAAKNGNHLAIRLNVLSDINPRVHEQLIKSNPDVTFYDYTKNNTNPIAPNHHYTYSSTGVSQPAGYNGLKTTINNPNQNWKQMRKRLDTGSNVAMAFSNKTILPERVIDEETGKIYQVIDGDTYDFRPLDVQPQGADGVIVGLRNKAQTRKEASSAQDSNGFFVFFDPQIQKAKGKIVKDESGQPVYTNKEVTIARQGTGQITMTNDYKPLGDK
jgi:hypothetical protein